MNPSASSATWLRTSFDGDHGPVICTLAAVCAALVTAAVLLLADALLPLPVRPFIPVAAALAACATFAYVMEQGAPEHADHYAENPGSIPSGSDN